MLFNYAKDRASRFGYPIDIDRNYVEKLVKPMICELSGLPLKRCSPGNYKTHPFAPSIDRIVPKLGYVKGNIRLVAFAVIRPLSDFVG